MSELSAETQRPAKKAKTDAPAAIADPACKTAVKTKARSVAVDPSITAAPATVSIAAASTAKAGLDAADRANSYLPGASTCFNDATSPCGVAGFLCDGGDCGKNWTLEAADDDLAENVRDHFLHQVRRSEERGLYPHPESAGVGGLAVLKQGVQIRGSSPPPSHSSSRWVCLHRHLLRWVVISLSLLCVVRQLLQASTKH